MPIVPTRFSTSCLLPPASCLLLLASCLLSSSCVKNPVTGKREFHMISEKAELRLGDEAKKEIVKEYGLYQNPLVQAYINEVAGKIVTVAERKKIPYDFVILDTSLVNAFAVPGTVFLTRGILDLIDDEAELAAVIGHEIGHINGYHSVKLIQKSYGYGFLATFAAIAGTIYAPSMRESKEYVAYYETLYRGIGLVAAGFITGYGREFEREADLSGLRYGILAGYDPDAMISFFKRMQTLEDEHEGGLSVFLRTHPPTTNRIKETKKIIASLEEPPPQKMKKGEKFKKLSAIMRSTSTILEDHFERYQEVVRTIEEKNENPGSVKENCYENKTSEVHLEVPRGWKLELAHGHSLVRFYSENGKAQGELQSSVIEPDPVLSADSAPVFAGTSFSTTPLTSAQWAQKIENGMNMKKRMGREVEYPCGHSYVSTYEGRDRMGRPAYYKTLYIVQNRAGKKPVGFSISCAAPEENYLDYLVDFEKIMRSLNWIGSKEKDAR